MPIDMYNNFISNMKREEKVNNTGRAIDFDEEMKGLKNRTEKNIPFTMTQVIDAMFLE